MAKKKQKNQTNPQKSSELMLERFLPYLTETEKLALLNELDHPLYPSLRINPLKVEQVEKIYEWAQLYRWQIKKIPFCDQGFWITDSPFPISKTIEHQTGQYYIQDAASMLPVELFDFNDKQLPLILDMAASPGGKTTHLVSKTHDKAFVLANDSSRERLTALRIVLQNWGASHVGISNYPGDYFGSWFPETFDRVLLDAPCSMQGLRESDSHSIKPITQKEINQLSKRQIKLLESAIKAVKIEGQIVYSTCTLTIEENEMVLDHILKSFPNKIQIDPLQPLLHKEAPALVNTEEFLFHPQVKNAARIWPFSFGTAGFFAARITKTSSIDTEYLPPPSRSLSNANWNPISQKLFTEIEQSLFLTYGFSLQQLIEEYDWEIWQYKNSIHFFPVLYLDQFANFPVQSLGLMLGELIDSDLQLSHEFITRFGSIIQDNIYIVEEDQLDDWMQGKDLAVSTTKNSGILIMKDHLGRTLGRGKFSQSRIRNMMPRRALLH